MSIVLAAWLCAAFVFGMGALTGTWRLLARGRRHPIPTTWPRLAILRPCAGLDVDLERNLSSTLTARYDGERDVYFLVASESDPAYAIAKSVAERGAHLVVTSIDTRHNRKVAQLAHAERLSDAPVVCVIDSDLHLDDDTLPTLVRALLSDDKAGAASCPPGDIVVRTAGDYASAAVLSSTPHAFYCLAALAEQSGGAHVLCGALIAVHRRVLDEVGGFASLEHYLGEDFELARRLKERGYTIPTASAPGRVTDHDRTLSAVLQRFARWATVTRQQRPHLMITYPLFIACTPLLLLVGAITLSMRGPWTIPLAAGLAIVVAQRITLAVTLRRAYRLPSGVLRSALAMLAGELTILVSTAQALGRPIVTWRGARYRIGKAGRIEEIT